MAETKDKLKKAEPTARDQAVQHLQEKGVLNMDGQPMPRRKFLISLALGWAAFAAAMGGAITALSGFMIPRVDFTKVESFKIGPPSNFPPKSVNEDFKSSGKFWVVNDGQHIVAISVVCTHLGCTPNWMDTERKFKCPCHGSGYTMVGKNFEGPAPYWLRRYEVSLADDGQIVVNKGRLFYAEKGEFDDPRAYIAV
jgi:cytochrome b6-f complex iron-sulfur subunit